MNLHLTHAIDGYWLAKQRDLSPNTVRDYQLTFKRLVAFLQDPSFTAIAATDLNRFLNHLQRTRATDP